MSQADCLFCKIIAGEIPAKTIFENDQVYAFEDIQPQAPTHILIIPKKHVQDVASTQDATIFANVLAAARDIANTAGLTNFRLAVNNGAGAGQSVFHLHVHLLSGRAFTWPPG